MRFISQDVRRAQANLARYIDNSSVLGILGDSRAEHYYVTGVSNSWVNLVQKFLMAQNAPGCEPGCTDITDTAYGISTSGTVTNGSNGPIGKSTILAAGASLQLYGAYSFVDVWYTQQPGAGTLTFEYNGTSYKTLNAAGTLATDQCSFPSLTPGGTVAGWYTITASGGPVEITEVLRMTYATGKTMFVSRFALSGMSTGHFNSSATLASIAAHLALPGTTPNGLLIDALGINNAVGGAGVFTSPAQYKSDLTAIYTALKAENVNLIKLGLIRPNLSVWPVQYSGAAYQDYTAAEIAVCKQFSVPYVPMDELDFLNNGLFYDGLHMNDVGNVEVSRIVLDALSREAH